MANNTIEDLKRQLNSSWGAALTPAIAPGMSESGLENDIQRDICTESISELAKNLADQVEYSNSLLKHIDQIEHICSGLRSENAEVKAEITDLRLLLREEQEKHQQSYNTGNHHKQVNEELASQLEALGVEKVTHSNTIEEYETAQKHLEHQTAAQAEEMEVLRGTIRDLQLHMASHIADNSESENRDTSVNSQLRSQLAYLSQQSDLTHNSQQKLNKEKDDLLAENSVLKQSVEQLLRKCTDEEFSKDSYISSNKQLSTKNQLLNVELAKINCLVGEMKEKGEKDSLMLEACQEQLLIKVTELEGANSLVIATKGESQPLIDELAEMKQQNVDLRDSMASLQQQFSSHETAALDMLRVQCTSLLKEVDIEKEHSAELAEQLASSNLRHQAELQASEAAQAQAAVTMSNLQDFLQATRSDSHEQVASANEALLTVQQQYTDFQRRFEEFQASSGDRHQQREEYVIKLTDSLHKAQAELAERGAHFVNSLSVIQAGVRVLVEEGREQRDTIATLAAQQRKMKLLMVKMTGRSEFDPHSESKDEDGHSFPILQSLVTYGSTVSQTLNVLVGKVNVALASSESLTVEVGELRDEKKMFLADGEQHKVDLNASLQQITLHKASLSQLQKKMLDTISSHQVAVDDAASERTHHLTRISRLEASVAEYTQRNLTLQQQLQQTQSNFTAQKQAEEGKLKQQVDRISMLETELTQSQGQVRSSQTKTVETQNLLNKSESKIVTLQQEFQKLRLLSVQLGDEAATERSKAVEQTTAMRSTLSQYSKQVQHLQQVIQTMHQQPAASKEGQESTSASTGRGVGTLRAEDPTSATTPLGVIRGGGSRMDGQDVDSVARLSEWEGGLAQELVDQRAKNASNVLRHSTLLTSSSLYQEARAQRRQFTNNSIGSALDGASSNADFMSDGGARSGAAFSSPSPVPMFRGQPSVALDDTPFSASMRQLAAQTDMLLTQPHTAHASMQGIATPSRRPPSKQLMENTSTSSDVP